MQVHEMLTDDDVGSFIALYKTRFGVDIDEKNAREKLSQLVRQFELVYKPITSSQQAEYVNEDGDNNARTQTVQ